MLQPHLLQRFAPSSLFLLYRPANTGSPGHDIAEHISKFATHRIDIQETQLIGGRVIGHIEYDLGPADDNELQHKILTIPYAEKKLESNPNAVEFVRVIKECAGCADKNEIDPRSLQIWASWAYDEIHAGIKAYDPSSGFTEQQHKQNVVTAVLTKLGRWAMDLTALTATAEQQLVEEPEVYEYFGAQHCFTDGADQRERNNLRDYRYLEVLYKGDTTDPFTAEMKFIKSKTSHSAASRNRRSDSEACESNLREEGIDELELDSMVEDFERVTEQYTEDGAISLHMSDGETFVVDGTLEDDVDDSYLPQSVAEIVPVLREMFVQGEPLTSANEYELSIGRFIETQLDRLYGRRSDREARTVRTIRTIVSMPAQLISQIQGFADTVRKNLADEWDPIRRQMRLASALRKFAKARLAPAERQLSQVHTAARKAFALTLASPNCFGGVSPTLFLLTTLVRRAIALESSIETVFRMLPAIAKDNVVIHKPGLYEFLETTSVYVNADERRYVEQVLGQILQNMGQDFILTAQRRSKLFRSFAQTIEHATDTRTLIECIREAYKAREAGKFSVKLFTALTTLYATRRAELEAAPLRRDTSTDWATARQMITKIISNMARNLRRTAGATAEFLAAVAAIEQAHDLTEIQQAIDIARKNQQAHKFQPKKLDQILAFSETKAALLECPAVSRESNGIFAVSIPAINEALNIPNPSARAELAKVASKLHVLPLQEKERIQNVLREARPDIYNGIKTKLTETIKSASSTRLNYLRFAFYEDGKTGAPNEPHNEFHLLDKADRAETWNLLKQRSGLSVNA